MVNEATILGRIGKDLELRQAGIQSVVTLTVATNEKFTKDGVTKETTEWHKVVVWGKQAEHCAQYLEKGARVYVKGKLATRKWEDKAGVSHYTTEIIAHTVKFLDRKKGDISAEDKQENSEPSATYDFSQFDNVPF